MFYASLQSLSEVQISYLSPTQAEAVTAEQQEEFTNSQLDALAAAGGTIEVSYDTSSDESSAGTADTCITVS